MIIDTRRLISTDIKSLPFEANDSLPEGFDGGGSLWRDDIRARKGRAPGKPRLTLSRHFKHMQHVQPGAVERNGSLNTYKERIVKCNDHFALAWRGVVSGKPRESLEAKGWSSRRSQLRVIHLSPRNYNVRAQEGRAMANWR